MLVLTVFNKSSNSGIAATLFEIRCLSRYFNTNFNIFGSPWQIASCRASDKGK